MRLLHRDVSRPRLNLDFLKGGRLDPRLTYTRSSGSSSFIDSSGNMIKGNQNLVWPSNNFTGSNWSNSFASRAMVSGPSPVFGEPVTRITATAQQFGALLRVYFDWFGEGALIGNVVYTFSVYARRVNYDRIGLRLSGDCVSGERFPYFNLATGVATPITTTAGVLHAVGMEPVGGGWYRCWIQYQTAASPSSQTIDVSLTGSDGATNLTFAGTEQADLYGMQIEVGWGAGPSPYVPTTTAAAGGPRFNYDPDTGVCRGLLVEAGRINYAQNSEPRQSSGTGVEGYWRSEQQGGTGVTVSISRARECGMNCCDYTFTGTPSAAAGFWIGLGGGAQAPLSSGQSASISTFARISGAPSGLAAWFWSDWIGSSGYLSTWGRSFTSDLLATVGKKITQCRHAASGVAIANTTSTAGAYIYFEIPGGVAASFTIRVTGCQIELGSSATSYIPTDVYANNATRGAEGLLMSSTAPWLQELRGTFVSDTDSTLTAGTALAFEVSQSGGTSDASTIKHRHMSSSGADRPSFEAWNSTSTVMGFYHTDASFSPSVRMASSYSQRLGISTLNRTLSRFSTPAPTQEQQIDLPRLLAVLNIGQRNAGASLHLNGHVRRITYYREALPASMLARLSAS